VGYRSSYGSYGDPWTALAAAFVWLAALLIILTAWALFQVSMHLGRAFHREPRNPVLWILLIASVSLWGLAALLAGRGGLQAAAGIAGAVAACTTLLLIGVAITISLTTENAIPREPESLYVTAFKKRWW
jgi:phosphoribosylcarboxyaminoimidazole (NCAIR) mutase